MGPRGFVLLSAILILAACGHGERRPEPVREKALQAVPPPLAKPAEKPAPARDIRPPAEAVASSADPDEAPIPDEAPAVAAGADGENSVYFPSGSARINGAGLDTVSRHAERLKRNPRLVVTLIGYTDPTGSRSYNLAIAEERLDSVAEALRAQGVARNQIRRVSAGRVENASCRTAACRQRLRRVDLVYGK